MLRYAAVSVCLLISLSACFSHRKAKKEKEETVAAADAPPAKPTRLKPGMTHNDALSVIKDRSELIIAEFNYARGHLVAYRYTRFGKPAARDSYYLYFMNDTLIRRSEPEPLKRGARLAIEGYYHTSE